MQKELSELIQMNWQKVDPGNAFQHKLQRIINKYLHQEQPKHADLEVKKIFLHLRDNTDDFLGGAIILVHQDWVEIDLLALIEKMRGNGLGKRMLREIEEKARELACKRICTETCEINIGFYQRFGYKIGGKLEDYPLGLNYFWLSKDLEKGENET